MAATTAFISVGTKVYLSAAEPATYTKAGFDALTWKEVGEVESVGDFGGSATVTTFTPLGTGVVRKRKGSIDYGQLSLVCGRLTADDGQALAKAGFDGANKDKVHSCKIALPAVDGKTLYFTGVISSFTTQVNDANSVAKVTINFDLDGAVIEG